MTSNTSMPIGRCLPHSIEAEEQVIACCFIDGAETLSRCIAAHITPASFYEPKHQIVFERMLGMYAAQKPTSIECLAQELTPTELERINGWGFLTQISPKSATTLHAPYFIGIVAAFATLRAVILGATAAVETCYQPNVELADVQKVVERIPALFDRRDTVRTWTAAVDEAEVETRERMKPLTDRKTSDAQFSWGIGDFDRVFQPIEACELIVIGGYTSSGKSSLLRQVAWSIAKIGHPALIETIEVSDAEEAINLAGHIAGIRSRARLDELHQKDAEQLLKAFADMRVPHFGVSHQDHSWAAMQGRARAFKRKHGLKFLGVDYLQIMDDVKLIDTRHTRPDFAIGCVTAAAKKFATTERAAVALLSGFNRDYVRDGKRDPKLSDLEGSSSIEKDASRVLLIHVPEAYTLNKVQYTQSLTADPADQARFYVKVIQAKGRNQGTASVGLYFHRETKTFHQIAK